MKRLFLAVASLALVTAAGCAGAYFTAQVQVAENVIRAGTVSVSAEPTIAALSIDTLAPGATVTRPLALVNDGNLPMNVVVTAVKKAGITEFWEALTCRVTADGALVYDGPLSTLRTTQIGLTPGGRSQLAFEIGLPAAAGNELLDDYVKLSVYADAEQAH
ncbi:MAG: TasA family protein [Coriobacteriia bacterium]